MYASEMLRRTKNIYRIMLGFGQKKWRRPEEQPPSLGRKRPRKQRAEAAPLVIFIDRRS